MEHDFVRLQSSSLGVVMLPIWFGEHRSTLMGEKTTLQSETAVPNKLHELSWLFTCCKNHRALHHSNQERFSYEIVSLV